MTNTVLVIRNIHVNKVGSILALREHSLWKDSGIKKKITKNKFTDRIYVKNNTHKVCCLWNLITVTHHGKWK